MSRTSRFSKKTKLEAIKAYRTRRKTVLEIANDLESDSSNIRRWIRNYESMGEQAFDDKPRNRAYSKVFKTKVIVAYLNGEGSSLELAKQYQITSDRLILDWVSKYNRHNEIKAYDPKGSVYMAKSRKVSYEEKLEIVKWTIEQNHE